MKHLQTRIAEAREELAWALREVVPIYAAGRVRAIARAEKRLADLEAVRDGKAVEVYATVSVGPCSGWISGGRCTASATSDSTLAMVKHHPDDRITILRGIAYLPITPADETEAESEVSDGE